MVEIVDERKNKKEFIRNLESGEYFLYKYRLYIMVYNGDYYEAVDLATGEPFELKGDDYVNKVSIKIIIQN